MISEPVPPEPLAGEIRQPRRPQVFSGRVIFDHLQKTAGMAVNSWLRKTLGDGCASPNLMTDHGSLIARYGGRFSVLTAHVTFDGQGLDPRYQYVTLLREPIDRMVSWLHYVVGNYTESTFSDAWHDVKRFLDSEGSITDYAPSANLYVRHFAAIDGMHSGTDEQMLAAALAAVERYDVWGLYESMPEFLEDFATLLGVPAPSSLDRVNVTNHRPKVADVGTGLRRRIENLYALDREFYAIMQGRHAAARQRWRRTSVSLPEWEPLHAPQPRSIVHDGFVLHAATIHGGETHAAGDLVEFDLSFSLARPIEILVIHVVITDSLGNRAFVANTQSLSKPIGRVAAGPHRVCCTIVANLPEGEYSIGFRFREKLPDHAGDLATFDGLGVFRIGRSDGAAMADLPATIRCFPITVSSLSAGWRLGAGDPKLSSAVGRVEHGSVVSDGRAGHLLYGPYKTVIAGQWTAAVEGLLEPGEGCLRIDVASHAGQVVHASLECLETTDRVTLDFQLGHPVHDLEIRVWVHELASARIDAIAVESAVTGVSLEGGYVHGVSQVEIETVREASTPADPAKTEACPCGAGPLDGFVQPDGSTARGIAAIGDPAGGSETPGLVVALGNAPIAAGREPARLAGRTGEPRADDARNTASANGDGLIAESRLTSRSKPTFSIVIATDGRAAAVAELLDTLPFLDGPPFEVCVVRGPTEDGIDRVLDAWRGRIKTACNPIRNLSLSRNIGIAMAAGDIVAFLDDDAIPETSWLAELADAFHDPMVACAGGVNRDRTGNGLQYGYATANRMGQARWDRGEPADGLCSPRAAEFPYVQGTNAAIRRNDLLSIGGFDEEYDFYLDETDLCCRLIDAGRLVRQLPGAFVHHRSLPSAIRSAEGVTHSLYAVLKNKLYFSLVNHSGQHTVAEALADFEAFVAIQEKHLRRMAATSADGPRWLERFAGDVERARATGRSRGCSGMRRLMSPGLVAHHWRPLLPLARRPASERHACTLHLGSRARPVATATRAFTNDVLREPRELLHRTWGDLLPAGTDVAVALYPDHRNVGDAAIWCGTRSLLRSLGVRVRYGCDPWSYDPQQLATAHPHGPILLLGGGNIGDVYGMEQGLRLRILEDFADRPIIQLPQSIWFRTSDARDAMAATLARCRDVTLLLRDSQSLAFARTHFSVRSLACPDAALALDLADVPRTADVPIVALWRRDIEFDRPLPPLPDGSIEVDWQDQTDDRPPRSWAHDAFRATVGGSPTNAAPCPPLRRMAWRFAPALWDAVARERTLRGCRLLARGRAVITNRLHAHLICTLLRIPHVFCDTVNGKLSAYQGTWHTEDPLTRFASTPQEAVELARSLTNEPDKKGLRAA